jgi:short-subunit dehydrogenase
MRYRLKPLKEQTIVVTGASSGIGLATAEIAARRGAQVVLVSRNADTLEKICARLGTEGGRCDFVEADVGDRRQVKKVVDTVVARYGSFDTWVNNAGVGVYARLEDTTDEDHERMFQTNYWGVVYGSLEALRHMRRTGGAIVNIGSIVSDMPAPVLSAYTASKHAVKGFTNALRMELIHDRVPVSVTLIKPSGIRTPFGDHAKNYMRHASQVPPPVYHPDLVAGAVLHAAEHRTREITIGASGMLMTTMARQLPKFADNVLSWMFFKLSFDRKRPKRDTSALYEPGSDGDTTGEQKGLTLRVSPYTSAQTHPKTTVGLGVATVAAVVAAAALARNGGFKRLDKDWKRLQKRLPLR